VSATDNTRATLLMVGSMLGFAFEDLFLKRAASVLPPGQVIAMMGAAGAACFWLVAWRRGEPILCRAALSAPALIRAVSEAVATVLYVTALALIPLSINSALLQASPLVVTMAAAVFLREPVGWRRWSAILVGFTGVLVILRPFGESFEIAGLLTVACVIVLAARDLATRVMPASIGTFQLTTWAYLGMVPAGLILMVISRTLPQTPDPARLLDLTGALVTGLVGYWAVTAAMRLGEVSVVAPFRYTRLVFSMILAMVFLGERPDALTYAGSALIIGSGLYTFWREARRKSLSKRASAG
jgi:drug/metabolite transporter (DMT)-like permease